MTAKHPAKFNEPILRALANILLEHKVHSCSLDPFGGTGRLGLIKNCGYGGLVYTNEIEPEWANQSHGNGVDVVTVGDACNLPYEDNTFGAIITSPVYGNKMSEHANWTDGTERHTYKFQLAGHGQGRGLHTNNAGRFYFWNREYADIHWRAWMDCVRVLKDNGVFLLNVKNFYRAGKLQDVGRWHVDVLALLGLKLVKHVQVAASGVRHGSNSKLRVDHEDIFVLRK